MLDGRRWGVRGWERNVEGEWGSSHTANEERKVRRLLKDLWQSNVKCSYAWRIFTFLRGKSFW